MTDRSVAQRLRDHVMSRGGPAKDDKGNYAGTVWPLMLEAADLLDRQEAEIASLVEGAERAAEMLAGEDI